MADRHELGPIPYASRREVARLRVQLSTVNPDTLFTLRRAGLIEGTDPDTGQKIYYWSQDLLTKPANSAPLGIVTSGDYKADFCYFNQAGTQQLLHPERIRIVVACLRTGINPDGYLEPRELLFQVPPPPGYHVSPGWRIRASHSGDYGVRAIQALRFVDHERFDGSKARPDGVLCTYNSQIARFLEPESD